MKITIIIAAIFLYPMVINATPNFGKHDGGRHGGGKHDGGKHRGIRSSESSSQFEGRESAERRIVFTTHGSAEHASTTETKSSSSSTTLMGGEIIGTSKGTVVFGGHGYICDCSDCVQHTYELTDEDLTFVNVSITTVYSDVQVNNCGLQLTKLSNENVQLTKQVNTFDSLILTLTKERNSFVTDLNTCRDKYTLITNDFVNITTEVKIVKRQLQDTLDDSTKLKTQWISATADLQKWKTKSDNFEIDLKRAMESNAQLTVTVNEYSTTITNLRSTINEITIKNNKCGNDSNEWKRKWEAEVAKVELNEKKIKELQASNDDLTSRITKLTNDLTGCRNVNKQNDIEINTLKDSVTNLTKQLSKCNVDLGTCNTTLKSVTDDFNADKLQDIEAEKLRTKLELQLSECVNRRKELELNLETERTAVDKCKTEVAITRNDCSKRYQKYEDDIVELKSNNKISLDNCEASLKLERDNSANSRTEITVLKNRITDLETKLSVSIKNTEDWQKKNQLCEEDSIIIKQKIETLQINVVDVNKHLSTCVTNGNSLQIELTTCKSNRDNCTDDLERTKKKLADSELTIGNLNISVTSLETAKRGCQTELSALRCDVDQYLKNSKSAQEKVNEAVLQAMSILDTNKKLLGNFVESHDTTCRVGAPLVS